MTRNAKRAAYGGLPGVDDMELEAIAVEPEELEDEVLEVTRTTLKVSVPFIEGIGGHASRRIDMMLTDPQAEKLRGILQGLDDRGATLESGQPVVRPVQAIQWLLENVAK